MKTVTKVFSYAAVIPLSGEAATFMGKGARSMADHWAEVEHRHDVFELAWAHPWWHPFRVRYNVDMWLRTRREFREARRANRALKRWFRERGGR